MVDGTNVFRGTSCLHLQKMEVAGSSEMLVPILQTTCHYIAEDYRENTPFIWSCLSFYEKIYCCTDMSWLTGREYTISLLEKLRFSCYGSVNWNYVFTSRDVIDILPWPSQQKLGCDISFARDVMVTRPWLIHLWLEYGIPKLEEEITLQSRIVVILCFIKMVITLKNVWNKSWPCSYGTLIFLYYE